MLESGVQEALFNQNIRIIESVASGINVQEMNDANLMQRFVVDKTMVLLRKLL